MGMTVIQELEHLREELKAVGAMKEQIVSAEKGLTEQKEKYAVLEKAMAEELKKRDDMIVSLNESLKTASDALKAEQDKVASQKAKLELLPVVQGEQKPVVEGAVAPDPKADRDYVAEYNKITDHVERAKFYKQFKAEYDKQLVK